MPVTITLAIVKTTNHHPLLRNFAQLTHNMTDFQRWKVTEVITSQGVVCG